MDELWLRWGQYSSSRSRDPCEWDEEVEEGAWPGGLATAVGSTCRDSTSSQLVEERSVILMSKPRAWKTLEIAESASEVAESAYKKLPNQHHTYQDGDVEMIAGVNRIRELPKKIKK